MIRTARLRRNLLAAVFGVTALSLCTVYALDVGRRLELDTVDTRFDIRGNQGTPMDLLVVKIDDATFAAFHRRPVRSDMGLPRKVHADAIKALAHAQARLIVYDVEFTEESENPQDDNALITAVRAARNVVLGTTVVDLDKPGETNVFGGGAGLAYSRGTPAHSGYPNDPGRVIRRMDQQYGGLQTLPIVAAEKVTGHAVSAQGAEGGTAWIDYRGRAGTIRAVSLADVVRGRVPGSAIRNKIVIVGAGAPALQDVHATSTGSDLPMTGPEIHANAIDTALRGFPLRSAPTWLGYALIILMALIAPLACVRLSPILGLATAAGFGVGFIAVAQAAFDGGVIVPVIMPLLSLLLAAGASLMACLGVEALERQRLRDNFARFVPESVVERVIERADGGMLGGQEQTATVLFSDLRGFTSFAETRTASEVMPILNEYLTGMSDAILEHGGTLIAYMGDGICAVFGAPVERPDHAGQAVRAAQDMLRRLESFNEWLVTEHAGPRFEMGIGLNTGTVMSGNVGSARRLEYAAIGDTTNTAARLEQLTKAERFQLVMADATLAAARATSGNGALDASAVVDLGEREISGRGALIRVWASAASLKKQTAD